MHNVLGFRMPLLVESVLPLSCNIVPEKRHLTGPDNIVIIKDGKPQRRFQITAELVNTLSFGFGDEVSLAAKKAPKPMPVPTAWP